jgi:hypothetical protein
MFTRTLLTGFLALVLLTRTVHCLYVDATLCAGAVAAQSESRPLSDPDESDPNESGCICKGAIFGAPCLIPEPERQLSLLSPLDAACAPAVGAHRLQFEPTLAEFFPPPPLSARAVRAWIGSWQI